MQLLKLDQVKIKFALKIDMGPASRKLLVSSDEFKLLAQPLSLAAAVQEKAVILGTPNLRLHNALQKPFAGQMRRRDMQLCSAHLQDFVGEARCGPTVVSPLVRGVVYISFNQDSTCIAIADARGIKIYSLESRKIVYSCELGAISLAEMLFSTSLMAYVGSGEQPLLTPRKLALMNTATQSSIQETSYTSTILTVRLNRKRLVAMVDKFMYIHALETMELLRTIDTAPNLQGLCALTSEADPNLLAVPAAPDSGVIRVHDLLKEGGNVLCELKAHKTSLAALAWNHNSTMLASASCKGTVVRVHCLPQGSKAFTFRRGTTPATIHSLAFSGPGIEPALLCACSAHGTVHIFSLETADRHPAAAAASGLLAAVMPSSVGDLMEPARCIATVRLPCQGIPCMCTFAPCAQAAATSVNGSMSSDGEDWHAQKPRVRLVAVTGAGMLHMYQVQHLRGPGKLSCQMEGETDLLQER